MRPTNAWGRVQCTNEEDRIGKPKDVFSRNPTGYPMWTEAMKAAIGPLRRAGRKWYSLYDKVIAPANVKAAWDRIDKRVTGKKLSTDRYSPSPVRRHYIPKPGSTKLRPLGLPTVRDRVVQEACRSMIEPIFEAEFLANSHGFRPGRSVETACTQVEQYLSEGKVWVVDLDIEKCYDSIPHEPLIDRVAQQIADGKILDLIRSFLKSGIMEEMNLRYETTGTPQGGIISPRTQKITSRSGFAAAIHWRCQAMLSSGAEVGHRNGMPDSNRITADQDFLDNQSEDFLPLSGFESFGLDTQFATKLG